MVLLSEFKKIFKEKGVNGLLPQNLPDELVNEFTAKLAEFTDFCVKHSKIFDENLIATPYGDTIRSINFLIEAFTRTTIGDSLYKSNSDEFNNGFYCIRYHYSMERLLRGKEIKLEKPIPTVEMILDKKYLPNQE